MPVSPVRVLHAFELAVVKKTKGGHYNVSSINETAS